MTSRSKESKAVVAAQLKVLTARAAYVVAQQATKDAIAAHPLTPNNDDWGARVDMLQDALLIEMGERDLYEIAVARLFKAWQDEGCSDAVAKDCGAFHDAESAARNVLHAAECELLVACRAGLTMYAKMNNPDVLKLFDDATDGKLYRGIPSHPSPYDKLLETCLKWNGRTA